MLSTRLQLYSNPYSTLKGVGKEGEREVFLWASHDLPKGLDSQGRAGAGLWGHLSLVPVTCSCLLCLGSLAVGFLSPENSAFSQNSTPSASHPPKSVSGLSKLSDQCLSPEVLGLQPQG